MGLGGRPVHDPGVQLGLLVAGVDEALTHEVVHGVQVKAILVSGDAAALVLSKIIMNTL